MRLLLAVDFLTSFLLTHQISFFFAEQSIPSINHDNNNNNRDKNDKSLITAAAQYQNSNEADDVCIDELVVGAAVIAVHD